MRTDPARAIAVLWGRAAGPRRGPRQAASVEEIVASAIGIADADGLDAVTMRAVGNELGRTAMSLYTYVVSRDVLIDLMYDSVHAELGEVRAGGDWRKAVARWSGKLRDLYLEHPWLLEIQSARPVLGPHEQQVLESLLRILASAELTFEDRQAATSALFSIVKGAARQAVDARAAITKADAEWWAAAGKALADAAPDFAERFPESTAVAAHQRRLGAQPWVTAADQAFTRAIELLIAGMDKLRD
ncbi:TetR/AcrR family transcriptional regulator C-terminal domain-containing protein [Kribbella sp. NPDC051718]|uniref:TetR/AcrR family transcriptional regulator C-terminal domain-containing protein n=1 Tax=Kribbella sp. NPDC051718 TaxID=3155168 RepID=UPI0034130E4A